MISPNEEDHRIFKNRDDSILQQMEDPYDIENFCAAYPMGGYWKNALIERFGQDTVPDYHQMFLSLQMQEAIRRDIMFYLSNIFFQDQVGVEVNTLYLTQQSLDYLESLPDAYRLIPIFYPYYGTYLELVQDSE